MNRTPHLIKFISHPVKALSLCGISSLGIPKIAKSINADHAKCISYSLHNKTSIIADFIGEEEETGIRAIKISRKKLGSLSKS